MTKNTTRWGIIGLGKIARKFAEDLRLVPGATLHAVASSSMERAKVFAEKHGAEYAFGAYEDLLRSSDVDIVYIATPHTSHYECTILCLNHGIPVLCEKPFAMNLAQARAMIVLAKEKQVFLMEALWTLFIPAVQSAFQMVREGQIGELHTVKADFGFKVPFDPQSRVFNKSLGGGSLLDIGIYPALLGMAAFGKPTPDNIVAQAVFTSTAVDETCFFNFKYGENKLVSCHSTIAAITPMEAYLLGTKGSIHLHPRWHHAKAFSRTIYGEETETVQRPYEGWGYHFEIAHVQACLSAGHIESPVVTHDFTLALMETMDNIREKIGLVY